MTKTLIVGVGFFLLASVFQLLSVLDVFLDRGIGGSTLLLTVVLNTPALLVLFLPLAVLIALLWSLRQLVVENEIVVARANGVSPAELYKPVIVLSAGLAGLHLFLSNFVVPVSYGVSSQLVAASIATQGLPRVEAGQINRLDSGLSLYVEVADDQSYGTVIFSDIRTESDFRGDTYAEAAYLRRTERGTELVLVNAVRLSSPDEAPALATFDTYPVLIDRTISNFYVIPRGPGFLTLPQLMSPSSAVSEIPLSTRYGEIGYRNICALIIVFIGWLASITMLQTGQGRFRLVSLALGMAALIAVPFTWPFVLGMVFGA